MMFVWRWQYFASDSEGATFDVQGRWQPDVFTLTDTLGYFRDPIAKHNPSVSVRHYYTIQVAEGTVIVTQHGISVANLNKQLRDVETRL